MFQSAPFLQITLLLTVYSLISSLNVGTIFLSIFIKTSLLAAAIVVLAIQRRGNHSTKKHGESVDHQLPIAKCLPVSIPFLDGLFFVARFHKAGAKYCADIFQKYGSTFMLPLGLSSTIFTSDPDYIRAILSSSSASYLNKPEYYYNIVLSDALKNGILGLNHEAWLKRRRAAAPAFTYKSFKSYMSFMNSEAEQMIDRLVRLTDITGRIDNTTVKSNIDDLAVSIISQIILGPTNDNLTQAERNDFHEAFAVWQEMVQTRGQSLTQVISLLWLFHPNRLRMARALDRMHAYVGKLLFHYTTIQSNKALAESDQSHLPFHENIVADKLNSSSCQEPQDGDNLGIKPFECLLELIMKSELTPKEIKNEVTSFMIVGHETVSIAVEMLIYHLAVNHDSQTQCQEEIDEFFKSDRSEGQLTLEDLNELKYLERCILESLRITPSAPGFMRWLDEPLYVTDNKYFEAGQSFGVSIWGLHNDPKIYPNPEKFDPDRFLPEAVKARHPYAYIPFSMGPRNCIGYKLAMIEMKVIMSRLIRVFQFSSTDKPDDVVLHFGASIKPKRSYNVKFVKRSVA